MSPLRAYLRLFRISVAFTPAGDVILGAALAHRWSGAAEGFSALGLAAACAVSTLIFSAAVAFNDLLDRHKDAVEAPRRPIPSGQIAPRAGFFAAVAAAVVALAVAALLGRDLLIMVLIVLALALLYDLVSRRSSLLGVLNLGLVRAADLGVGWMLVAEPGSLMELTQGIRWLAPAVYGVYALALSGVALSERRAKPSPAPIFFWVITGCTAVLFFAALGWGGAETGWRWLIPPLGMLLLAPLVRYLLFRQRTRIEPIVGHMVSGYLLMAALPVGALLSPTAGLILAGLFVLSRVLSRLFPPA